MSVEPTRRDFLQAAGTVAVAATIGPVFVHASDKAGTKPAIVGAGEHRYECRHDWGRLPDGVRWGETHGVAVDAEGLIYVKHRNRSPEVMDAIVVFDPQGNCVRSFGKEFHGGGHGIDVRTEGREQFLYLCDVTHFVFAKTTLTGEVVWKKGVPQEPGVYKTPQDKFSPTNVCFAPDGGFYVADGYGSHFIHQYDKDAKWVRTWGGAGKEPGRMQTPHGLWLDDRPGRTPSIVVADRANARLQYFTLDGRHLGFVHGLRFPAAADVRGDVLLVPDLHARITLFDAKNEVIVHLGDDPQWTEQVLADKFALRSDPKRFEPGRFVHPHDAAFDREGNVYVAEWVPTGRLTFLRRV